MKNKQTRFTTSHLRNIPVDVKAQFKAYCARRGYSMQDAVVVIMKKVVAGDVSLPGVGKQVRRCKKV